jgi:hypothetical protein
MSRAQIACITGVLLVGLVSSAHSAGTCTGQYDTCFNMCRQYGFGRHRADHPHPQSANTCRDHCIGWKTGCMQTGCWSGDLVQVCGLQKR